MNNLEDINNRLSRITYINDNVRLVELCMRNVLRHLLGNTKYTLELESQFDFIMQKGTEKQKELVKSIMKHRSGIE